MQVATLQAKHAGLAAVFTERSRRLWAATEARAIGHGGIALVERATGISRSTIQRGLRELDADAPLAPGRTRQTGGGRKRATTRDQTLLRDLDALGWVSVGIDHDTASFAVNAIRRWWQRMGRSAYPQARSLVITADAGGSNGTRLRLWKWELQRFANRTGLAITVCHFPPGTSEWNRIEHRLFSHIAMNWRGTPLVNLATIVSLIGSTHSRAGLRVRSEVDRGRYPGGVTLTNAQMTTIRLQRHRFHGDWNYTIHPTSKRPVSSLRTAPSSDAGRLDEGRRRKVDSRR